MDYDQFFDDQVVPDDALKRMKFKARKSFRVTNIDVLVNDDRSADVVSPRILRNIKNALKFLIIFVFNLGPAYIMYFFMSFKYMQNTMRQYPSQKLTIWKQNKFQIKRYSLLDQFLCISVCSMIFLLVQGSFNYSVAINDTFINWFICCIVLLIIYVFFMTGQKMSQFEMEYQTARLFNNIESDFQWGLEFLYSQENFQLLGLGLYSKHLTQHIEKTQEKIIKDETENFSKQVMTIIKTENIDPTFLYFSLNSDPQLKLQKGDDKIRVNTDTTTHQQSTQINQSTMHIGEAANEYNHFHTLSYLRDFGFKGFRQVVDHFLLPHYLYTHKFKRVHHWRKRFFIFLVILIKIVIPLFQLKDVNRDLTTVFQMAIIVGFYIHFLSIIYELTINDDLKTKNYMLLALQKLISLRKVQSEGETPDVLDITCPISLQGWSTMSKLVFHVEKVRTHHFNFVFRFLFFYGKIIFIAFLLCKAPLPPFIEQYFGYCSEDIILFNIQLDVTLVGGLCVLRIYFSDVLSQNFSDLKDTIQRLLSVYEDLFTLFEYYFVRENIIEDKLYRSVVTRIQTHGTFKKRIERWVQDSDSEEDQQQDGYNHEYLRLEQLLNTAKKIKQAVEYHIDHNADHFMGLLHIGFPRAIRLYFLLLLSFVPSLYQKMQFYVSQMS